MIKVQGKMQKRDAGILWCRRMEYACPRQGILQADEKSEQRRITKDKFT